MDVLAQLDILAWQYVLLAATGAVAGVLGGMLGIGGSVIMLPAMVWVLGARNEHGMEMIHQYMAAAMVVNFLLVAPSVYRHRKAGAIWGKVWIFLTAGALPGMILGVQLSQQFQGQAAQYLRWLLAGFFAWVVVYNLMQMFNGRRTDGRDKLQVERAPWWHKVGGGLLMGSLAGVSGIGGGALAVPVQQFMLKMPLRSAIGTSAATILSISLIGAISKNAQLGPNGTIHESLVLVWCLAPAAMVGSYIGAHLTHKLPLGIVRAVFTGIMILAVVKMATG